MCVDAKDTASLTLSKCGQDYVASQEFTWDPHGRLHAADLPKNGTWPMCLVPLQLANSTHVQNGSAVRTAPCSTDDPKAQAPSREMWRPNLPPGPVQPGSTFTLMNVLAAGGAGPAMCLDALSTNASNGAPVRLMACQGYPTSSAPTQHWALTLVSSGSSTAADVYLIRSASQPGMCLDGLGMTAGTRPVLWECNRFEQQLWGCALGPTAASHDAHDAHTSHAPLLRTYGTHKRIPVSPHSFPQPHTAHTALRTYSTHRLISFAHLRSHMPTCTSPHADEAYKGSPTVFLFLRGKEDFHGCLHYEKVGDYWQLMIGDCVFWGMGAVA